MNLSALRNLDLNLLVVFHTLMHERHVTRAASRLHLSQGALSAALGRLRASLGDPLFVRTRTGMEPTATALALAPKVAQALTLIDDFLAPTPTFTPHTSDTVFHLAMSDDLEAHLVPRFLREIRENRLAVRFAIHQSNSQLWEESILDPDIDMVICSSPTQLPTDVRATVLFATSYSCLYDPQVSTFSEPLTLEQYAQASHILVSYNTRRGFVDDYFELHGTRRRIDVSLSHFAGLPVALHSPQQLATLPTHAAAAFAAISGLHMTPAPIPVPTHTISMLWRAEHDTSEKHSWLRGFLQEIAAP